ncbi:uncharacterized protein (TIGR04141 family) [Novosphingobium sp. 1748]|uniref:DUF6119 family protein n=1 Tax=Novosphingobium sp. 1748 TaxID=2817760 RepID=UPI002867069F|nr:DUF6119 family protein [Novosphingobium sp. 1748]MDR6710155.1 uncharacterized protein (TIGR04141 family) [Novosphingobium sp. 1748]
MLMIAKRTKAPADSTSTISIRLLRKNYTVDESVRDNKKLTEQATTTGRLFHEQTGGSPPGWLGFVNAFVAGDPLKLQNQSCSAVLFLDVTTGKKSKRTFAFAFGAAHLSLQANAFERNFGLKVALNSVARANLKNVDVATLDATSFQKRVQASRKSDLGGFGIDVERDLFRLAGGVPTDTDFANSLAGRDALTLNTRIIPTTIADKCRTALKLFEAQDYKKDYAFIDQVTPVREADIAEALDDLVYDEIQLLLADKPSDLHLTIPEIIDPEQSHEIGFFGVGFRSGSKRAYGELTIEDYIHELKNGRPAELTGIQDIKASHEIRVVIDGQGQRPNRRKVYDCMVFETIHKGSTYVLFAGDWYCVDNDFYRSVEADFQKILSNKPLIAKTKALNERELIKELDADPDLLMLDQVKVSPASATGANIEPCDFLSRDKAFIHLKDGHGSDPISHLWNQGVVSAESFVRDATFRNEMRTKALKRQKETKKKGFESVLPDGRQKKPTTSEYRIVYGIMRHAYKCSKKLGLPFFSKVSLRSAAQRLELMGFTVEVHLIEKQHA